MKNADMPAMPISVSQSPQGDFLTTDDYGVGMGLTKREHFAVMAMQGLLGSFGVHDVTAYDETASDAVMAADALLKELEK